MHIMNMRLQRAIKPGMIPFWFFNDASPVAEKLRFLRRCRKGGFRALAMHCRSGNLIPYASEDWYAAIRALVAEARRLDMKLWLYDEDPFPSGAAGGQVMATRPELMATQLVLKEPSAGLAAGQLWEIAESPVVWAGLVPVARSLAAHDLTRSVGTVRRDWFVGPWDSRYYYPVTPAFPCVRGNAIRQVYALRVPQVPKGYKLAAIVRERCGEDGPWGSLPDCLNPETFAVFRQLSLDPYKRWVGKEFGRTIPGIFTDEEKPHGFWPVTPGLFEAFRRACGFDLRPRLHQLFGEPLSDQYVETRLALREWIAGRFQDAFLKPYRQWCDAHGLLLVGHMSPEDDPVQENGCLGSVMPLMKLLHCPGTDLIAPFVGDRRTPTVNLGSLRAGSLRAQTRAPAAVAETFGLFDWDTTTAACRRVAAWHRALGIDRLFPHGFFQSVDGPIAHEAPPDYGPRTAIFEGFAELNRWSMEMEEIMDGARDRTGVAVLNSLASYWDLAPGMDAASHEALRDALWQTLLSCLQTHVGVHLADEADVAKAGVSSGWLRVGACRYHTLLIPAMTRIPRRTFDRIAKAAAAGVRVVWFGGGPRQVVGAGGKLRVCAALPGHIERLPYPTLAWCREQLAPLASLSGRENENCYVRRFSRKQGPGEWLFAVNVGDRDLELALAGEGGLRWFPERVDGETWCRGAASVWRVPAGGNGLFRQVRSAGSQDPTATLEGRPPCRPLRENGLNANSGGRAIRIPTGDDRVFRRLEANRLRLDRPAVRGEGIKPMRLEFPMPYWQLGGDYPAERIMPQFVGRVPVLSPMPERALTYRFAFTVTGRIGVPELVCEPRCARGVFGVAVNGRQVGGVRCFPLESTRPLRIPLPRLNPGDNVIELRFQARSAMDGLLAQLFVEGEFEASIRRNGRAELAPVRLIDSRAGWQAAGLPHYMGSGSYTWQHRFDGGDAKEAWDLEFDAIVDCGELYVNGKSLGRRAWAPWRWRLPGLKVGMNAFHLQVHGTGGNLRKLIWPEQPQGWIGRAWLVKPTGGGVMGTKGQGPNV